MAPQRETHQQASKPLPRANHANIGLAKFVAAAIITKVERQNVEYKFMSDLNLTFLRMLRLLEINELGPCLLRGILA